MPESKILAFDIFGSKPEFNINHKTKVKSVVGVAFTGIVLILTGYFIFLFGESLFKRINPSIIQSDEPGKIVTEPISIFPQTMVIGLFDIRTQKYYIDPTLFTIAGTIKVGTGKKDLSFTPCLPKNISEAYGVTENLLCLDVPDGQIVDLQIFDAISIKMTKCAGANCQDSTALGLAFQFTLLKAFWTDVSLDTSNFDHPVKGILNTNTIALLPDLTARLTIGFKKVEVNTDEALVGTSSSVQSYVGLDIVVYTLNDPILSEGACLELSIFSTGKLTYISRRYQKIQDVIAQTVSVVNIIVLAFGLIGIKYASLKMFANLSNNIMDVKYDRDIRSKTMRLLNGPSRARSQVASDIGTILPLSGAVNEHSLMEQNSVRHNDAIANEQGASINSSRGSDGNLKTLDPTPVHVKSQFDTSAKNAQDLKITDAADLENGKEHAKELAKETQRESPKDSFSEFPKNLTLLDMHYRNQKEDVERRSFSFKDIIDYMVCKKRKVQEINIAKEYVEHYLNVETIFQKLSEIDTLKEVLFTPEQRYLFERVKKPKLRYHIDRLNNVSADVVRHYHEKGMNAEKAYTTVKSRKEKSTIDENLLHITNYVCNDFES